MLPFQVLKRRPPPNMRAYKVAETTAEWHPFGTDRAGRLAGPAPATQLAAAATATCGCRKARVPFVDSSTAGDTARTRAQGGRSPGTPPWLAALIIGGATRRAPVIHQIVRRTESKLGDSAVLGRMFRELVNCKRCWKAIGEIGKWKREPVLLLIWPS